jgi:hypothetical protein
MNQTNGFDQLGDMGGPQELGNGYRWNVPVVTYAFDSSFLDYFGANGVAAVNGAIQILNSLPPASQIDSTTFPLNTTATNGTAQAEGLIDLKSETLSLLLQQMGLAQPQRFMFCVHDYSVAAGTSNALIVLRNFDPLTSQATNGLNGVLCLSNLTWNVSNGTQVDSVKATAYPVVPSAPTETAVADGGAGLRAGLLYTGLTYDDVGGLRYLLRTNNVKEEPLLPDVSGTGTNANQYVNDTTRAGVDKITFIQGPIDSITGSFLSPITAQYIDTYQSGGVIMHQQLQRVITKPDILFTADDTATEFAPAVQCTSTTNWLVTTSFPEVTSQGIIRPQITIAFRKSTSTANAITSDSGGAPYVCTERWASYDSSTNVPIIYPLGPAAASTNSWSFQFSLIPGNNQSLTAGQFTWQLPIAVGQVGVLETSTNLTDWTPLATATNVGAPFSWEHIYSRAAGYFRVVAQ